MQKVIGPVSGSGQQGPQPVAPLHKHTPPRMITYTHHVTHIHNKAFSGKGGTETLTYQALC